MSTKPKDLTYCHLIAANRGGYFLSNNYINDSFKYQWKCKNAHIWLTKVSEVTAGSWCKICAGLQTKTIDDCIKLAATFEGKCLSIEYKNARTKYVWQCKNNHQFESKYNDVQSGHWCPKCQHQVSKQELELQALLKPLFNDIEFNKKGLLKSKRLELDIYIPSLNKAIEFDGHRHIIDNEQIKRDIRKNQECCDKNICLLRIKYKDYIKNKDLIQINVLKWLGIYGNI